VGKLDSERDDGKRQPAAPNGKRPDQVYLALLAIQAGATRERHPAVRPEQLFERVKPCQ
jgi:hypothetical protein